MFCCFRTSAGLVSLLAVFLGHLDSSSLLSNRGSSSRSRGGSNWDAADEVGEGSVVGDVLDGGGGDDSLGQQLGGGGNTDGGHGVGVHLGHSVGNWSSHHSLADGVDESVLVEILREAFQGKRAKTLGGLDGVSEGRSEGSSREARVDMGGGSREADGEERRQDKGLHSDSLGWHPGPM